MTRTRATAGLTVIEVLVALAIIGVVTAAFTTGVVSTVRHTSVAGAKTQAVQVLNYLGRRVAGGDNALLPDSGSPLTWGYGGLPTAFPDMTNQGGFAQPSAYRASISNAGSVSFGGASAVEYDVRVCFKGTDSEHCVSAATLGPEPSASASVAPLLPGIN